MRAWRERRGPEIAQFGIDLPGGSCRRGFAKPFEHAQPVQALALAQLAGARGVVGHGITHDVALWLVETRSRLPDLGQRGVVERECRPCHNEAILP
jgi:hypothetical protein